MSAGRERALALDIRLAELRHLDGHAEHGAFQPKPCQRCETIAAALDEAEARGREAAAMSDAEWMGHCEAAGNQARAEGFATGREAVAKFVSDHLNASHGLRGDGLVREIRALQPPPSAKGR